MEYSPCDNCPKRDTCRKACDELKKAADYKLIPWEVKNHKENLGIIMEKHSIPFAVAKHKGQDKLKDESNEEFGDMLTYDDLGFKTDDMNLELTKVFIERFFKQRTFVDIADQLNINPETATNYYGRAVKMLIRMINLIDSREKGIKYMVNRDSSQFSYDERAFLLNQVFGFSVYETAEILGEYGSGSVKVKVRRLKKKYRSAFDSADLESSKTAEDVGRNKDGRFKAAAAM